MKDFYSFAPHSLLISDLTLKSTDKYCPDLLFCPPLSVCLHPCLSNLTLQRYTCTMNNNRKKKKLICLVISIIIYCSIY